MSEINPNRPSTVHTNKPQSSKEYSRALHAAIESTREATGELETTGEVWFSPRKEDLKKEKLSNGKGPSAEKTGKAFGDLFAGAGVKTQSKLWSAKAA